ncbi:MAG: arylsulfatase [Phycisphaeraceae bacterium]|nr:arylsulfatase [Phycisphaeraceae bacterium]
MTDNQPNIILIMTDQQRGDCLGIEGHPVLQTTNIDRLAHTGTRFQRGYAESPSCIPARRSLMTGTAPAANGMVGFENGVEWNPTHTLAGELTKAGYQTQLVGKLHLWPPRMRFGFNHMLLADSTKAGLPLTGNNDYVDWVREVHGRRETDPAMAHGVSPNGWVGRPNHLPEEQTHTFWCIDQAMQFLERRDPSTPFFLNISFIDPHPPFTPPQLYYDRYERRDLPPPVVGDWALPFDGPQKGLSPDAFDIHLNERDMHCARAAYYGMINFIDDQIGRLLRYIGKQFTESFVVYASDHGEMLGDHNLFRKGYPYEASARIPFLMRAPESWRLSEQVTCDSPVGLQDIMPTLLDAAGINIPDTCTGQSLLPIMRGDTDRVRDILHGEHASSRAIEESHHFITDGHIKYVWFSQTGREQLFNLDKDPNELYDLAAKDHVGQLQTWRGHMVEVLEGRPEGFTNHNQLIKGRPTGRVMPGYEPDKMSSFN